jgi:hypothetical protein
LKKIVSLLLVIGMCLLPACQNQVSSIDMTAVQEVMTTAAEEVSELSVADSNMDNASDLFLNISDMDYDKVSKYFLLYSSEGTSDEIAVIEMKNSADTVDMEESLKKHLESRKKLFQNYAPDQVKAIESAQLFSTGNYTVLIICDKASAVKEAFLDEVE